MTSETLPALAGPVCHHPGLERHRGCWPPKPSWPPAAAFLQYRNKPRRTAIARNRPSPCAASPGKYGARLIINDDVDLALFCEADGVHLGEDDGEQLAAARIRLDAAGPGQILGASCYQSLPVALAARHDGRGLHRLRQLLRLAHQTAGQARRSGLLAAAKARNRPAGVRHRRHHPGQRRGSWSPPAPICWRSCMTRPVRAALNFTTPGRGATARTIQTFNYGLNPQEGTHDLPQRPTVRTIPESHSRRRQLAGARLPLGGRHAALLRQGAGQPGLGRGRQVLSRLRRLLGPADPGPRRPGRGQGGAGHRRPGPELRRPDRNGTGHGGEAGRPCCPAWKSCAWFPPAPKPR
jgi:hypothetical protein